MDFLAPSPVPLLSRDRVPDEHHPARHRVALAPHHDLVRLAEDDAMLDVISDGRLDLVLSRGTFKAGFDGFNQDSCATAPSRRPEGLQPAPEGITTIGIVLIHCPS